MTKRFQRKRRKGIKVTDRDRATIEAVFESRYMTNQHIGRLFYAPTTQAYCRQRCRFLYDKGYLFKRQVHMDEPDIYYLGTKGRHYIEKRFHLDRKFVKRVAGTSGTGVTPNLYMPHELTISKLYVDLRLECEKWDWDYQWRNTRMLEDDLEGLEPDAWLCVSNGDGVKEAFVEFTRQMPSASELKDRLASYKAWWERKGRVVPVLWFTTSRGKANRLLRYIRRDAYWGAYLVGLIEDKRNFLTAPIWHYGEEKDVRFVKPPSVIYEKSVGDRP